MKKIVFVSSMIMVISLATACGSSQVAASANGNEKQVAAPSVSPNTSNLIRESDVPKQVVKPIDVDLTALSSTMVYSEVYQMVWHPERYVGKVVKMNGQVSIFESKEMNRTYYTCVIADATACCSQGIEFRLIDNNPLPSSYNEGDEVMVVGEFNTYKEGAKTYCELINAKLL